VLGCRDKGGAIEGQKKRSHEYNVGKLVFGYEFKDLENGT